MGVHGLWQLLSPVARPIALETMANKRLAIDASIWLYQFQMAMRDRKSGDPLQGAHIMGTFRRIVKLLYHGIKPVFVFDGDAPMLKKRTIVSRVLFASRTRNTDPSMATGTTQQSERKRRKAGATKDLAKTAQQLLSAQLRAAAAEHQLTKLVPSARVYSYILPGPFLLTVLELPGKRNTPANPTRTRTHILMRVTSLILQQSST